MKKYNILLMAVFSFYALLSCSDNDDKIGNPSLNVHTKYDQAMFGDSLYFSVDVSDKDVPLSTVKAQLYFDEELVSENVIRTKTEGSYEGRIYIPFLKDVPDGTAKLKFILQNINFTIKEEVYDLPLVRPNYTSLTLVTENDERYIMERSALNQYEVTADFPRQVKGYIEAPAMGDYGNVITFGWEDNSIVHGSMTVIPFSNLYAGVYTISFNTLSYDAAPFIIAYSINEEVLYREDDNNYFGNYSLKQGESLTVAGFDDLEEWWLDTDFIEDKGNGEFRFKPISGTYRITANFEHKYFRFDCLSSTGDFASLQEDGSGAIWILGDGFGKPSLANGPGWNAGKGVCLAPIGGGKHQVTFVSGKTIKSDNINFKFFHQNGWGGEFGHESLTTNSDLIFVGAGETPGPGDEKRDNGNLGLLKGKKLEEGVSYVFTVDASAGKEAAVLTVEKK